MYEWSHPTILYGFIFNTLNSTVYLLIAFIKWTPCDVHPKDGAHDLAILGWMLNDLTHTLPCNFTEWYYNNLVLAPLLVNQPWRTWVDKSYNYSTHNGNLRCQYSVTKRLASCQLSASVMYCVQHFNRLQWRHNGHDGVSNHQPHDCLLNRLFRRGAKKTSKLRVTGLCEGNSPVTGEFPAQKASDAENISTWWHHHIRSCHFVTCWCFEVSVINLSSVIFHDRQLQ